MRNIWCVARFQLLEGWRERWGRNLLIIAAVLVLASAGVGLWSTKGALLWAPSAAAGAVKVGGLTVLALFALTLLMGAPSLAALPLGGAFVSGTFYTLLPRAFSRAEIYVGKLIGLVLYFWGLAWAALGLMVVLSLAIFGTLPPGFLWAFVVIPLQPTFVLLVAHLLSAWVPPGRVVTYTFGILICGLLLPSLGVLATKNELVGTYLEGVQRALFPVAALPDWQFVVGQSGAHAPGLLLLWVPVWIALVVWIGIWRFRRLTF